MPQLPSVIVSVSWALELLILGIVWSRRRVVGRFVVDDGLRRFARTQKLFFVIMTFWCLHYMADQHVPALLYSDQDYLADPKLLVWDLRYVRDSLAHQQAVQGALIEYLWIQSALCAGLFASTARSVASRRGSKAEGAVSLPPAT
jgi:hypothetical protein